MKKEDVRLTFVVLTHLQESGHNDFATTHARVLDKRLGSVVLDGQKEGR